MCSFACLGCSGSVYMTVFHFLPISSNFTQPLKRSGPTFHRPLSTTWSTLCEAKLHISEWPFIVASLRPTCAVFMLSNQHLDMPHLLGGMDYLGKVEVLTNTDLDRFVNIIWEKLIFCVYRNSFRSLSSAHEKMGAKSVAFIFLFSVITHFSDWYFTSLMTNWL